MDLNDWKVVFKPGWDKYFSKFDPSVQKQILKKIEQMSQPLRARGLHGSSYCVEEVGQYRIAFYENKELNIKEIHFIGDHTQYKNWYSNK